MKSMRGIHARIDGLSSLVLDNPLLALVAAIGFSVSFQTVAKLAAAHGLPGWPPLYPVGIDVGILALVAESRMLITMKPPRSDIVPRVLAWALASFTVWVNIHGSPASDWLGRGLHGVMPCLWVVFLELTRRRLMASQRADMIPVSRWVAAPLQTPMLWQRMHRDGITSWPLALETEQARLHARDLVRAAPPEHRPSFSSLLRKRIRSGRLPDPVRRAVKGSLANEYAPGWEDAVTEWVTGALALPAHLAANLENTRAATAETVPVVVPEVSPEVPSADIAGASAEVPAKASSAVTARRRRVVPSKAGNEELAALVVEHAEDMSAVNPYRVDKILKEHCNGASVGDKRLAEIAELARRKRVVPIGERKRA